MRIDGPTELTEGQKLQARTAGIPADRPGLGAEYPKMVYRPGENERHMHMNQPLKIGNGTLNSVGDKLSPGIEYQTAFVDSPEDEVEALADGWMLSPDPGQQAKHEAKVKLERAKDDEIATLKAQLAGKGRSAN
jgi:hypothetical protein